MARNGWHATYYDQARRRIAAGGYRCEKADLRAARLSRRARVERKLRPGTALWELMVKHLRRGLSPAQIESTLSRMPEPVQLSRETIYTSLYAMPRGQLRASLLALMRRRHKTRKTQLRKTRATTARFRI
jgi:transposase, IS30 family